MRTTTPVGVPDSLKEVVANRLRRLTASGRGVIELVAVAGQRVELRVLNTVEHSDEWLTEGLDEDVEARLLTEVGGLQPTYEFVHAIVRDTVEEMISPAARARLHLKLGRATETTYAADPRPVFALLARHFAGGAALGGATQALYYSRKAAEQAMRSAAYDEAISHLIVVFELSEPGSVEQVDVMLELGNAKSRLGLHRDAIATFGEAFRAARERWAGGPGRPRSGRIRRGGAAARPARRSGGADRIGGPATARRGRHPAEDPAAGVARGVRSR